MPKTENKMESERFAPRVPGAVIPSEKVTQWQRIQRLEPVQAVQAAAGLPVGGSPPSPPPLH
jgi:hypothetical protein